MSGTPTTFHTKTGSERGSSTRDERPLKIRREIETTRIQSELTQRHI